MSQALRNVKKPLTSVFNTLRNKRGGLPLMIVALIVLIMTLLIVTRPKLEPLELPEKVWVVEAISAQHKTVQPELTLYGLVFAGRQSQLRAQVSGNVVAVGKNYKDGAWIDKGDLLVEIDPFDYETDLVEKQAQLSEAKSKLELFKRDYVRAKELYRNKDASKQFLDNAELSLEQQQSVLLQREVGVKRAKRDLQQTRLLAPYSGVVDEVNAELGMRLSTNDQLALLLDTYSLEVRFSLSNAQFGRILDQAGTVVDRPISIFWRVGEKILRYSGKVERQGAQISSDTGGVDVYATLTGSEKSLKHAPIRPGAFVQVSVADRVYENVMVIPEQALYGRDTVYVVKNDRLESRQVEVVGTDGNQLLIQSAGDVAINDNDLIVVTQIREGGVGTKVSVKEREVVPQYIDKIENNENSAQQNFTSPQFTPDIQQSIKISRPNHEAQ